MTESQGKLKDFAPIPVRAALDRELGAAPLRVLILIASHSNKEATCWPSQILIAERLGVSQQAVGQHVKKLEKLGYIEITHRKNQSNLYKLIFTPSQAELVEHTSQPTPPLQAPELVPHTSSEACTNKPTEQTKENKKGQVHFVLPDWIDPEDWAGFEEMRRKQKRPFTDHARKLSFSKLEKLKDQGHDTGAIIQETIINGWSGFFPPRNQTKDNTVNNNYMADQQALLNEIMKEDF